MRYYTLTDCMNFHHVFSTEKIGMTENEAVSSHQRYTINTYLNAQIAKNFSADVWSNLVVSCVIQYVFFINIYVLLPDYKTSNAQKRCSIKEKFLKGRLMSYLAFSPSGRASHTQALKEYQGLEMF